MAGPLLSPGAGHDPAGPLREQQEQSARWVEEFLAPGLGPHGGAKLLAEGADGRWVESAALALAEAPSASPLLQPYRDLARKVHQQGGDQATNAVLLAARLVRMALEPGLHTAAAADGLRLARRQAVATLASLRRAAAPEASLATVAAVPGLAAVAVAGLRNLGADIDLDAIDVRAEAVAGPAWLDGLVAEPQHLPRPIADGSGRILLLAAPWRLRPRADGTSLRIRDAAQNQAWLAAERDLRDAAAADARRRGIGFIACTSDVDDGVLDRLTAAGIVVWTGVPLSTLARLERATGARRVASLREATTADLGTASWQRRPRTQGGWLLAGSGASATLVVPASNPFARDAAVEDAERMLRAAGLVLAHPGAVPGGGRWQRAVAASLRAAADAAPGKAPLGLALASRAVASLADDLVRNAGHDPVAEALLPDAAGILDAYACVDHALRAAFDTALGILRLDGAYRKRASQPAALRGGLGRAGSARGMPGDIPPLM